MVNLLGLQKSYGPAVSCLFSFIIFSSAGKTSLGLIHSEPLFLSPQMYFRNPCPSIASAGDHAQVVFHMLAGATLMASPSKSATSVNNPYTAEQKKGLPQQKLSTLYINNS